MATIAELKQLALHAAKGTAPDTFSTVEVNAALVDGLKELAGNYTQFMKNRFDIYEILIETIDEVVPNRVIDAVGIFADVRQVAQGEKVIFKQAVGKNRAKKFLTRVALSGVYETVRLDTTTFELPVHAIGGACSIDFERMLDGAESMAEVMEVMTEGLTDSIYIEVQRALRAAVSTMKPTANKYVGSWSSDQMVRLCNIVKSYGQGATIFAPPEFIAAMGPDAIVPVSGNIPGVYHPQDIDRIHYQGYINIFRGTPVVAFRQSYVDENNTKVAIDPQFAYILPTGGERVVKVVLEGSTQIHDWTNTDGSMEIHFYKKLGTGILTTRNWAIFQNTGILAPTMDEGAYGI